MVLAAFAANADAAIDIGEVLPLGDSITYGEATSNPNGTLVTIPGGYRSPFYADLTAASIAFTFVGSETANPSATLTAAGETAQEGHPGYTNAQLETGVTGYNSFLAAGDSGYYLNGTGSRGPIYPADILLLSGINDLREGDTVTNSLLLDGQLLTAIFDARPTTHVFLGELLPDTLDPGIGPSVNAYNAGLATEVAEYTAEGYAITLVDTYDPFTNPGGSANTSLFYDGLHPDQAGYDVLGNTFAAAVEASVPEPASLGTALLAGLLLVRRRR